MKKSQACSRRLKAGLALLPFLVSACAHDSTKVALDSKSIAPRVSFPPRLPSQSQTTPEVDGQWSPLIKLRDKTNLYPGDHKRPRPKDGWFVTPIQAVLLANGDVLITGWNRTQENYCEDHKGRQNGTSFVLSPNDLTTGPAAKSGELAIESIPENPKDKRDVLYCAGHAPFPDGRVLFMGGARYEFLDIRGQELEYGINYGRLFDPKKKTFTVVPFTSPAGPNPTAEQRASDWSWYEQGMMWYPTNTRLPGGKQLIAGGFAQQNGPFEPEFPNKSLAVFDTKLFDQGKNPWSVLVSHEAALDAMNIGPFDYPHSYLLYEPLQLGGRPRQVATWGGQNGKLAFLNIDPGTPESERLFVPPNAIRPNAASAADKTSLLLPSGEIMMMGGGADGLREAQRLDIYDPKKHTWRSLDTGITRIRPASTLLPDGTVLIMSGEGMWQGGGPQVGDRRQPTLFDPARGSFANLAPWTDDPGDRGYHNISLLLKDGRVLVGGGRTLVVENGVEEYRIGCERTDLRIYSPPYLFKGPRPEIVGLKDGTSLKVGSGKLRFKFNGAKLRESTPAVLVALGAETHHFDQNQRLVPLKAKVKADSIEIQAPATNLAAPEGQYLLFLLSEQGVPSVAKVVQLN